MLERKEILALRPEFKFGNMTMIDWFEIHEGAGYCTINSGLKHADGFTKSPYDYIYFEGGENASENVIKHFNNWWEKLNKNEI